MIGQSDAHVSAGVPAKSVALALLNRTNRALMNEDFSVFVSCFLLPHVSETFEGKRVFETEDDLRDMFFRLSAFYRSIGLTKMVRNVVSTEYKDVTTIQSTHETRLLCHGTQLMRQPYPVFSVITRVGDEWKIAHCKYAIPDSAAHGRVLLNDTALAEASV